MEQAARKRESDISLIVEREKEIRAISEGSVSSSKVGVVHWVGGNCQDCGLGWTIACMIGRWCSILDADIA